jgi:hypothetical protein
MSLREPERHIALSIHWSSGVLMRALTSTVIGTGTCFVRVILVQARSRCASSFERER